MVTNTDNPVSYDVDADKKFKATIEKAIKSGLNLSFAMGESARIIKKESAKNFILKGTGKYPPLSKAYAAWKQEHAPGTPILTGLTPEGRVSGKLKKSIIGQTSDSILLIGKHSLVVGTKAQSPEGDFYPRDVQEGKGRMPARKFLFFSQAMVGQIMRTIDAEIARLL
jgi:phage gpG-like protein